jgi:hypothetical protein
MWNQLLVDPAKRHDDLRLIRRAMRQRWEIPDRTRALIMERLAEILEHGADDIALKAVAEIRHMEAQNQKDEHKIADYAIQQRHARVDAIARELGVDPGLIVDASEASGSSVDSPEKPPAKQKQRAKQGRRKKA